MTEEELEENPDLETESAYSVEDDHLTPIQRRVVPDGEHPSVIFGRFCVPRDEDRLAGSEVGAELLLFELARLIAGLRRGQ